MLTRRKSSRSGSSHLQVCEDHHRLPVYTIVYRIILHYAFYLRRVLNLVAYIYAYTHTYVHTYVFMSIYIYMHIYVFIHIYMCMWPCSMKRPWQWLVCASDTPKFDNTEVNSLEEKLKKRAASKIDSQLNKVREIYNACLLALHVCKSEINIPVHAFHTLHSPVLCSFALIGSIPVHIYVCVCVCVWGQLWRCRCVLLCAQLQSEIGEKEFSKVPSLIPK